MSLGCRGCRGRYRREKCKTQRQEHLRPPRHSSAVRCPQHFEGHFYGGSTPELTSLLGRTRAVCDGFSFEFWHMTLSKRYLCRPLRSTTPRYSSPNAVI